MHVCAGKPEGEPSEHYVRGAQESVIRNLENYQRAGNELKGRNITTDRAYTGKIAQPKFLAEKIVTLTLNCFQIM